jgi:hypothetical protein
LNSRSFAFLLNIFVFSLSFEIWAAPFDLLWEKKSALPREFFEPSSDLATPSVRHGMREVLEFSHPKAELLKGGRIGLGMVGASALLQAGEPQLPRYLRQFKIPNGFRAVATLEGAIVEESSEELSLPMTPEPYEWSPTPHLKFLSAEKGRYFPGSFIQSTQFKDSLHITLYPVQWDRFTGKVLWLKRAELKISLELLEESVLESFELWGASSLIITSERLRSAAELLQKFHEEKLGVKSEIVTVEDIAKSTEPIGEEDLPEGYKTKEERDKTIVPYDPQTRAGYNYELSRRISAFLQSRMSGSLLKSVTVLGDASLVPPSYYYAVVTPFTRNYAATDRCYGAVKKCREPRLTLGRLPFSSEEEVKSYLDKANAWITSSQSTKSELGLYGGHAFASSDVYVGELGALRLLETENANWSQVRKVFQSNGKYTKEAVLDLSSGKQPSSHIYYLDHGNGNQWFVDRSRKVYVTSAEILEAQIPKEPVTPLVVSISCTNAAFDQDLLKEKILAGPESEGKVSIGVALLKSRAGAVAYLGSARSSIGQPVYRFDSKGNLSLVGTNYGMRLLEGVYESYQAIGHGTIGMHFLRASQSYIAETGGLSTAQDEWTYFIAQVLGDPLLPLPNRKLQEKALPLAESTFLFDDSLGFGVPLLKIALQKTFAITFESSSAVEATLMEVLRGPRGSYEGEKVISQQLVPAGKGQVPLTVPADAKSTQYFLRLENKEGVPRERHVMFETANE